MWKLEQMLKICSTFFSNRFGNVKINKIAGNFGSYMQSKTTTASRQRLSLTYDAKKKMQKCLKFIEKKYELITEIDNQRRSTYFQLPQFHCILVACVGGATA